MRLFLNQLRSGYCNKIINKQQLKTLRGQALSGDLQGAKKGLCKIAKKIT